MLGMPSEMVVDTNDTYALMSPYYAWFAQDTWRVNRNLTLTLGLRMEYERGATERYNRAIAYFDPNLELPISAAAQAAYARNPIPGAAGQRSSSFAADPSTPAATACRASCGGAS